MRARVKYQTNFRNDATLKRAGAWNIVPALLIQAKRADAKLNNDIKSTFNIPINNLIYEQEKDVLTSGLLARLLLLENKYERIPTKPDGQLQYWVMRLGNLL